MADFLTDTRAEIERRLEELRPLQEEYNRLERAKAALDGIDGQSSASGRTRGPRSGGTSGRTAAGSGRRAAPANGALALAPAPGGRSAETLELVRQSPGIMVRGLKPFSTSIAESGRLRGTPFASVTMTS